MEGRSKTMAGKGLLMVHTGNGKGKTTAALGLAFRAMGHGLSVCIIQFIKGKWKYGELKSAGQFKDLLDFHVVGRGFTWESEDLEKDCKAAQDGWALAKSYISAARHHLVVLDEFTYVMNHGVVDQEEVLGTFRNRPAGPNILVTGRDASERLVELADLVTEMRDIKHPYYEGIEAQKGIEW
jgi:cob(I)alamin adenosyltransferase